MLCPECLELGEKNKMRKIDSSDAIYEHGDVIYQCEVCYHEEPFDEDDLDDIETEDLREYEEEAY